MPHTLTPERFRRRLQERLRGLHIPADDPAGFQAHHDIIDRMIGYIRGQAESDFATSRTQPPSEDRPPIVNIPTSEHLRELPAERNAIPLPPMVSQHSLITPPLTPSTTDYGSGFVGEYVAREEPWLNIPRTGHPVLPSGRLQPSLIDWGARWIPESSLTRVALRRSLSFLTGEDGTPLETEQRSPRSWGQLSIREDITSPEQGRQMCKVRALEVQIGDILKTGNRVNDRCVVTQCHPAEPNERPPENDEDYIPSPINLNGTIVVEYRCTSGPLQSMNFGGLDELEVLRIVSESVNEEEEDSGSVACGSDRDER